MSRARRRLIALGATGLLLTLGGLGATGAAGSTDSSRRLTVDVAPTGTPDAGEPGMAPTSPTATPTLPTSATATSSTATRPVNSGTRTGGGSGQNPPSGQTKSSTEPVDQPAAISLTSLTPGVVTPTSTLVIKGTVTNTGATPIENGVIRLLVHHAPLATRTQVAQWSSGGIDDVGGRIFDAAADLTVSLDPGTSTRFTIKAPADRLGLSMDFASIGITLEALGDDGSPLGPHRVGLLRTYLTWQQTPSYTPLRITWLLPVTGGPTSATGGPPDAQTLADAVGTGTRLRNLLTAITAAPRGAAVSVAADPALVADLHDRSTSAGGGTLPAPSSTPTSSAPATGGPTTTTAEQAVASYLSALKTAVSGRRIVQLPYADPDLAGVVDGRGTALLTAAQTAAGAGPTSILGTELGSAPITDVGWPVGGWADPSTIAAAPRLGLNSLVLAASSRPPSLEQSTTPTGVTPLTQSVNAVLFDDVLSTLLGRTSNPTTAVLNTQRFLAESLATVYERPDRPRILLVAPARSFDPDPTTVQRLFAAIGQAQWIAPATLSQLRVAQGQGLTTVSERDVLPVPGSLRRAQLPASQITVVRDVRTQATQMQAVISGDPTLAQTKIDALRLVSAIWRGRVGTAALRAKALKAALTARAAKVHILPLSDLNFLASDGNLTLSVANELAQEVKGVRVVVQPGNGRLVVVKQAGPITVEADRRTTIKVHVHAVAGGMVPVTARILTPDGLQMGKTVTVQVHVRPTDTWAFWVIGIAAGLTFVIGLIRTLRRGRARPRLIAPEVDEL